MQPEIDVPAGATNVAFGEDGTVTAILPGDSDATELGQLTLVNFANPAGLSAEGDNLYLETAASGQPTEGVPGEDGLALCRTTHWKARTWISSTKWWR